MLQSNLTDPVIVEEFTEKTDLVEYTLSLLGKVDQMNIDRATIRKAVEAHNGKAR
jgi:hypothetical protein